MMNKTPAEQAIKKLLNIPSHWRVWNTVTLQFNKSEYEATREALSLLARVQRGEVKVLARVPNDAMKADGGEATKHPIWIWAAMWDAAPAIADGDKS